MAMQDRYPFRFIGTSAGQHGAAELDQAIAASWAGAIERDSGLTVPTRLDDEGGRDALTELAVRLDRAQVPYALTGSAAGPDLYRENQPLERTADGPDQGACAGVG